MNVMNSHEKKVRSPLSDCAEAETRGQHQLHDEKVTVLDEYTADIAMHGMIQNLVIAMNEVKRASGFGW